VGLQCYSSRGGTGLVLRTLGSTLGGGGNGGGLNDVEPGFEGPTKGVGVERIARNLQHERTKNKPLTGRILKTTSRP